MDYKKIYKELSINVRPLPDNYNPNQYAKALIQNSPCYVKAIKNTSTSIGTIVNASKND